MSLIDFIDPAGDPVAPLRVCLRDPIMVLQARRPEEVAPVLAAVHEQAMLGRWCVGYVRYEAAAAFDKAFKVHPSDGPLTWFAVHESAQAWPEPQTQPLVADTSWHNSLSRAAFDADIDTIHRGIAAGELYQINYTAPLLASFAGSAETLFWALRQAQPNAYSAFIDTGEEQILSVSPELFFDWDGDRILSRPMKGTAPRGTTAQEDSALAEQLRASPKERAENVMIVDLIRNDLSRVARPFSVTVPRLFHVETLPTVLQMTSDVRAQTRPGTTLVDVFAALFPCGSITGAPKVQAMRLIHELEPHPRGVYCGAVGLVRPGGRATFNVAIRTVTIQDGQARCGIGSGITADAGADAEWAEWRHKRAFLDRASRAFSILETLALQDGFLRNLADHLHRMAEAAQHFGFPWDAAAIEQRLRQVACEHPAGHFSVRMLLDAVGRLQLQVNALKTPATPVRLMLAPRCLAEAQSEFVRYKTTLRDHYDALAPQRDDVFDTVLWNCHSELTEGTRSNLAFLLDGRWVTPVLSCGLLGGIERARLLQQGRIEEAVIRLQDLDRVQAVACFNSLRGWLDAVLLDAPVATRAPQPSMS